MNNDITLLFTIALLTMLSTALVFIIVFIVLRRFDIIDKHFGKMESSYTAGWNMMVNKLMSDMSAMNLKVTHLEEELTATNTRLTWVNNALDYLCNQVLTDYPVAVENAHRLARGEVIIQ